MSGKKRILIVCQHFWPENFRVSDIAKGLIERGFEVDVLCGIPNYPKGGFYTGYSYFGPRRERHEGAELFRAGEIPRGNNSSLRIFLNYIYFPLASLFRLPRLLFRHYDKIFIYQLSPVMMAWAGLLLGTLKRVERTLYVLDIWPENLFSVLPVKSAFWRAVAHRYSRHLYKKPEKLIALTPAMRRHLEGILPPKKSRRIAAIPQYCEDYFAEPKSDPALRARLCDGRFTIVFTGNFSPAQSLSTAVAAAAILRGEGVTDFRFVLVGDGMSRAETERQVAEQGLGDFFVFEGGKPPEAMPCYFDIADCLMALMEQNEGLDLTIPAKVSSYMAGGRPLLLAMGPVVDELIDEARCGFLSSPGDAAALARNVKALMALPESDRAAMGERARRYYEEYFKRDRVLSDLIEFVMS